MLEPLEGIIIQTQDESGALVTIQDGITPVEFFTRPDLIQSVIYAVQDHVRSINLSADTAKGRREIKALAFRITRTKTAFEEVGKKAAATLKELPKQVDAGRKLLKDGLEAIADERLRPVTEFEEAEKKREKSLAELAGIPSQLAQASVEVISAQITLMDTPGHYPGDEEYCAVKAETIAILCAMLRAAEKREAEAAELLKLREEKAKQDQKDREEQIRRDAEAKAKAEAEERTRIQTETAKRKEAEAKLAQEKAEQAQKALEFQLKEERRAAEERQEKAAREAILKEREEQEFKAKKEQAEREAASANLEHRKQVNKEAWDDLNGVIDSELTVTGMEATKAIFLAIRNGSIRHISINY